MATSAGKCGRPGGSLDSAGAYLACSLEQPGRLQFGDGLYRRNVQTRPSACCSSPPSPWQAGAGVSRCEVSGVVFPSRSRFGVIISWCLLSMPQAGAVPPGARAQDWALACSFCDCDRQCQNQKPVQCHLVLGHWVGRWLAVLRLRSTKSKPNML